MTAGYPALSYVLSYILFSSWMKSSSCYLDKFSYVVWSVMAAINISLSIVVEHGSRIRPYIVFIAQPPMYGAIHGGKTDFFTILWNKILNNLDNWRRAEARADHIRLIRWPKLQQAHLCSCSFSEFGKKLHTRRAPRSKEIYKPGRRVTSETSRSSSKTLWYGEDERLKDIRTCLCPTIK